MLVEGLEKRKMPVDDMPQELWFVSQRGEVPHIFDYGLDATLCGEKIHRDGWQCAYTYTDEQICSRCIRKNGK